MKPAKHEGQPSTKVCGVKLTSATGNPQETFDALLDLDGKRVKVQITLEQSVIK